MFLKNMQEIQSEGKIMASRASKNLKTNIWQHKYESGIKVVKLWSHAS